MNWDDERKRNRVERKRISQPVSHRIELEIKQGIIKSHDEDGEAAYARVR